MTFHSELGNIFAYIITPLINNGGYWDDTNDQYWFILVNHPDISTVAPPKIEEGNSFTFFDVDFAFLSFSGCYIGKLKQSA
jgi:hypothetical protein